MYALMKKGLLLPIERKIRIDLDPPLITVSLTVQYCAAIVL
jgi:hypothetical protein